jgi:flagellar hook assembly protein FlgD
MLPVAIEVYDQVGAKVKTLTVGMYEAGRHRVVWRGDGDDGRRVSSGVYYYRLVSEGYQSAKKMILLR